MPIISMFFGIIVRMYGREHERLIRGWAALHRKQLEANWGKMKRGESVDRIEPLE